jgi:hypothetical protein
LSLGDVNFADSAGVRRGDFDRRFVGLQLKDRLIGSENVPFLDQERNHIARFDAFAQLR